MRDDLTAGFIAGKNKSINAPALLLKLEWPARSSAPALTLRLADRPLSTGPETWQPLVLKWHGEGKESLKAVTLWNGPFNPAPGAVCFSDLFTRYPPEIATVTLFQWFESEGLGEGDVAPLFAGVIEGSLEYDSVECQLPLAPYSESLGKKRIGTPVTLNDYPNVPEKNLGKSRPIVFGSVRQVPGLRVRGVKRTVLTSVALPGSDTLKVATAAQFPDAGLLVINDDEVAYTGKSADQFTGCSGITEFHYADDEVLEKVSDHRFLFSDPAYPIQAINQVCIASQPVSPGDYTVDLAKGEVVFHKQPQEVRSIDTKFLQAQFDEVAAGNTAIDPSFAMQPNLRARYAKINQSNRKLHLRQADVMEAPGQISRVLLRIEHFMEERLNADSVVVRLSGVGQIGTLSPPAQDDLAISTGSTDVTHNHLDTFGFPIDIPQPPITPTSQADHVVEQGATSGTGRYQNLIAGFSFITIQFPAAPAGALKGEYQLNLNVEGGLFGIGEAALYFHGQKVAVWNPGRANFDYTSSFTLNGGNQPSSMTLSVASQGGQWTVSFTSVKRLLFYPHDTQATQQSQQTLKTGSNTETSIQPTLNVVTEKSTRTVVDFFDVTDEVDGDWSWFTGRELEVEYTGSSDGRTGFILHTAFEIEYARRRLVATDDITADVNGVVDDASGSVSGTANLLLERPDHLFLWSLKKLLALPDASIDLSSFTTAGDLLTHVIPGGYRLGGVVQNAKDLSTLWQEWLLSSRCHLLWNAAGLARLQVRPLNSSSGREGQEVKTLDDTSVLVNPGNGKARVRLRRGPASEIATALTLPYERNWNADAKSYRKLLRVQDTVQSELFGTLEQPGGQPLDWCPDDAMASDLAAFYLAGQSRPATLLECDVALEHLDLEWGDIVRLNHPDAGLTNVMAQLVGRTDLSGGDTPDGLQAVRLMFHLFPIEFLQESLALPVASEESFVLSNHWNLLTALFTSTDEIARFEDLPAAALESTQAAETRWMEFLFVEGEITNAVEAASQDMNVEDSKDSAGAFESAFTSANGGWGLQSWGFTGWGGREVLM